MPRLTLLCCRDIKLENLLIEDRKVIKIIDFGFSVVSLPTKR